MVSISVSLQVWFSWKPIIEPIFKRPIQSNFPHLYWLFECKLDKAKSSKSWNVKFVQPTATLCTVVAWQVYSSSAIVLIPDFWHSLSEMLLEMIEVVGLVILSSISQFISVTASSPQHPYVEYIPGNTNLIFSVPHDGKVKLPNIPVRKPGCRDDNGKS